MDIILASQNKNKIREVKDILTEHNIILLEDDIIIEETGTTYLENALIKAQTICKLKNIPTIADDSGIEIDFLDKQPGVYSARFLGEETSHHEKNLKILDMLKDVPFEKRIARFVCFIVLCFPNGNVISKRGVIEGYISDKTVGGNGFGYDPIFYLPKYNKTISEVSIEIKNKISHRAIALEQLKKDLDLLV